MKILLINPKGDLEKILGVGKVFVQKFEPLGLLYIATYLKENGYKNIKIIDAYAEELSIAELKRRIIDFKPDIIGISVLTANATQVYYLGRWIKKNFPEVLVVLGNIHASVFAKEFILNNCCDIVVHGEGELPFLKIVENWNKKGNWYNIPAISFFDKWKNEVITTSEPYFCSDLTKLPIPDRSLINSNLYYSHELSNLSYIGNKSNIVKTMITSRGCPNRCTFCVVHNNQRPRYNSIRNVVEEMELLEKKYNAKYVFFMDPLFVGNKQRVFDICDGIIKRGLKIKWGCEGHINYIDETLIKKMEEANCYEISLGIESGNQKSLDIINKKIKIKNIVEKINLIKKKTKIKVEGLFMLGIEGETEEDILNTIKFAKSLPLDMAQFSILTPYPGSPIFYKLAKRSEIDTGVRDGNKVIPEIWRRYSSYICFSNIKPIWTTKTISVEKLRYLQKKAFRDFYLRPKYITGILKRIRLNNITTFLKLGIKGIF